MHNGTEINVNILSWLMHYDFINEGYLELTQEQKEFSQRFLFLEYLEEWERSNWQGRRIPMYHQIISDMYLHIADEQYETAQLYKDTIELYEIDMTDFE